MVVPNEIKKKKHFTVYFSGVHVLPTYSNTYHIIYYCNSWNLKFWHCDTTMKAETKILTADVVSVLFALFVSTMFLESIPNTEPITKRERKKGVSLVQIPVAVSRIRRVERSRLLYVPVTVHENGTNKNLDCTNLDRTIWWNLYLRCKTIATGTKFSRICLFSSYRNRCAVQSLRACIWKSRFEQKKVVVWIFVIIFYTIYRGLTTKIR